MARIGNTLMVSISEHGYLRESSRLKIRDITKPSDPRMLSSIDSEGHIQVIEMHNDIVFMNEPRHSTASWLNTMDLSNQSTENTIQPPEQDNWKCTFLRRHLQKESASICIICA